MSASTVLTLGLGAFTGGGVKFLVTLGFGTAGDAPIPVVVVPPRPGGDSTRLRRRRRRLRYWWEKDEPEEILVLSPEEAVLEPVVVQALWEERAVLNDYIIEMSFARASQRVIDKLKEVDQHIQARIDVETARQLRIRKKVMLLLGDG